MTFDEALSIARARILQPGSNPGDYACVNPTYPQRITKLVISEARHIMRLSEAYQRLGLNYDPAPKFE